MGGFPVILFNTWFRSKMLSRPRRPAKRADNPMATTIMVRPSILLVSFLRDSSSLDLSPWEDRKE